MLIATHGMDKNQHTEADHLMMFHIQDNIEFYNVALLLNLSILQAMTNGH